MADSSLPKETIYQLKVTLQHVRPPVWRRFQVRGRTTLAGQNACPPEDIGGIGASPPSSPTAPASRVEILP